MNGTEANEVIIGKIAKALSGIAFDQLTKVEKAVVKMLKDSGWVYMDGEDQIVKITPYGAKYV